jgi:hypothetical protein
MQCENAHCRKTLRVPDSAAGKRVQCPDCGQVARVPAAAVADAGERFAEAPRGPSRPAREAGERFAEAPRALPRRARAGAPSGGSFLARALAVICWLGLTGAFVGCLGFLAHNLLVIKEAERKIARDPGVKKAREAWLRDSRPDGFQRYLDAERKATQQAAPERETARSRLLGGAVVGGVMGLGASVTFVVMLALGGPQFVCRFYVACCLATLLALLGAGAGVGLVYLAAQESKDDPEVKRLQDQRREAEKRRDYREADRISDQIRDEKDPTTLPRFRAGAVTVAASVVLFFTAAFVGMPCAFSVLVYKLWAQVQDGRARTTPGMALGGLFIPFFNLYWAFVALPGVAHELNRCADDESLDVPRASPGLMIAYNVLCFVAVLPFVGVLASLVNLFVAISAFRSATRVAVALSEAA